MSGYRILSRRPGFRRAGIAHPAVKDYAPGELTAAQLAAIRAEPNLSIVEFTDTPPSENAALADGTLPSASGGEDSLALIFRAFGMPASVAPLVAVALTAAAVKALAAGLSPRQAHAALQEAVDPWGIKMKPFDDEFDTAPQQPAETAGAEAEPETEIADQHGNEVAQASDSAASGQAASASETGEATEGGSAAAAPVADPSHQDAQPAADHAPGAPAEGAEGTAAPSANPPAAKSPAKPVKASRKAR